MATNRYNLTGGQLVVEGATGTAAIATSAVAQRAAQILSVTLNLSLAPTTSEDFTVTLNSAEGAAYDTLLYSLDLSTGSTTDLIWQPDQEMWLQPGDSLDVAFTNTDTRTYGILTTLKEAL